MKPCGMFVKITLALCVVLLLSLVSTALAAEDDIVASGECGDAVYWKLTEDGTMTIYGSGDMWDLSTYYNQSYYSYRASVLSIKIENDVTRIGKWTFSTFENLRSINISDDVTSIGEWAFERCTNLESVKMPDSITSIEDSAFQGCTSLTSMKMSDNLKSIGDSAFFNCESIVSINLSNSITSIGDKAFSCCYKLTSIQVEEDNLNYNSIDGVLFSKDASVLIACPGGKMGIYRIPDSVINIGGSSFYGCWKLSEVEIPDGVTNIGIAAFLNCTHLEKIKIPDSVVDIGSYAFANCWSLASIEIPDSVMNIGSFAFGGCENLTSVVIPDNLTHVDDGVFSGCTSLKSIGIPNGVTSIGKLAFYDCRSLMSIKIPESVLSIGIEAFFHCWSLIDVYYGGTEAQWNAITIGSNNDPLLKATIHFKASSGTSSDPIQSVILLRDGKVYDLLTTAQVFRSGSEETVWIRADVNWGSAAPGRVVLSQGMRYLESADGIFESVNPAESFDTGKEIYIIAVDSDGNTVGKRKLCLSVVSKTLDGDLNLTGGDFTFKLFNLLEFKVDEDKPVLGGMSFKTQIGDAAGSLEIDPENMTFKAVIGADIRKNSDGKLDKEEYSGLKGLINDTREKIGTGMDALKTLPKLNKLFGRRTTLTLSEGWKPKVNVSGYIEGIIDENGKLVPVEGGVIVLGQLKHTSENQTLIGFVPVCYTIGYGGSVTVKVGIKDVLPGAGFEPVFAGNMAISPFAEIGGGIGICYVGSVGARGKASLNIHIALDHDYQKVDLRGEAFFEVKAFTMTLYERKFAEGEWVIYETGRNIQSTAEEPLDYYAGIDIHAQAMPEDRSYAQKRTRWLGSRQADAVMGVDYTNREVRVLQSNTYPDAAPLLLDADGTKVMLWLEDNTERAAENKTMLVYSVYDAQSGLWSEPEAVLDDGMGDYYPAVGEDCVVWQKANRVFGEGATLAQIAGSMEIWYARFNGTGFDEPVRLTDDDVMDAQPHVAADGEKRTVVWTCNSEDHIFGLTGRNSIWRMAWDGESWSEPECFSEDLNAVTALDVGYFGGEVVIAYVLDADNSLMTVDDREIYLIRNGMTQRFTDNDVLDSNPVFGVINEKPALFWYSDGNVYYLTDLDEPVLGAVSAEGLGTLTDDYTVFSNGYHTALLWTAVEGGVSEVYGVLYDGLQWSRDIRLTQAGQFVQHPCGVLDEDGRLLLCFNRTQNIPDGYYFRNGQADLCTVDIAPSYDLAAESAYLDAAVSPNTEIPIALTVVNSGELPIRTFDVEILDVNGARNYFASYDEYLQPGEAIEIEAVYTTGEEIRSGRIRVAVHTDEGEEYDSGNNALYIDVGQSDPEILEAVCSGDGDEKTITVSVHNSGYTDAEDVLVQILDQDDAVIAEKKIDLLRRQETCILELPVDFSVLESEYDFYVLKAEVSAQTEDADTGNNRQLFTVHKMKHPDSPNGDINGDGHVTSDDAIYLLRHTLNPDRYPINQTADFNDDGYVTSDDAIYLLRHTLNPDRYPLH